MTCLAHMDGDGCCCRDHTTTPMTAAGSRASSGDLNTD